MKSNCTLVIESVYKMGFREVVDVMFFVCTVQLHNETSHVRRNYSNAVSENKLFGNFLHFNIVYLSLWRETRLLV